MLLLLYITFFNFSTKQPYFDFILVEYFWLLTTACKLCATCLVKINVKRANSPSNQPQLDLFSFRKIKY